MSELVVSARGLVRRFRGGGGRGGVVAVDGVDLDVRAGTTHAVVGESGSGKSTLCRLLSCLDRPDGGSLSITGVDPWSLRSRQLRSHRRQVQLVFQDAAAAFDPRLSVLDSVAEAFVPSAARAQDRRERAAEALARCGLGSELFARRPQGLSGGELQRAALARAVCCGPSVLLLDEPVTALDMTIRAQLLELLEGLQAETGVALVLVSHDLAMVSNVADTVSVMFDGRIIERGSTEEVFGSPRHPYTEALIAAIPGRCSAGATPSVEDRVGPVDRSPVHSGCRYRLRCGRAVPECAEIGPLLTGDPHEVACHLPLTP